ncbi:uncharacterized protein LOC128173587 [Crassostrea angulata]|uniref:uncharacterized protein LOC128173587 n=1 Tax=Magallana angulata TaxID=2784310 RepID=UPI0022B1966E|nr:uncharacterized protein LOC128173587 [Crassostrea angulata]
MDSTTELDTDIDEQESFHLHIEETPDADDHRLSPIESESGSESILSAPRSKKKKFQEQTPTLRRSPRKHVLIHKSLSQQSTDKNPKASNVQTRRLLLPSDSYSDSNDLSIYMSSPGPLPPLRKSPRKRTSKCKKSQLKEKTPQARNVVQIGRVPMPSDSDSSDIDAPCGNQMSGIRKSPTRKSPRKRTTLTPASNQSQTGRNLGSRTQRNDMTQQPNVHVTPGAEISSGKSLKQQLQEIIGNQKEMMQGITSLKKDVSTIKGEMEKRKANEPVEIPSKIRVAVKDFYTSGLERDMTWNLKKRYTDEDNFELTNYIKTSVQGIAPDTSEEVIHGAIKTYFTSKKEAENRMSKNKAEIHKKRQATYERKKEKLRRRLSALDKKTKWSKDKKELVRGLLSSKSAHKYMSSDEEGDDGFISHPFSWESESFRSVKDSLDKKFLETCPVRSKRLLSKRTRGSLKDEEPPTLPEQFMWIVSP